MDGPITVHPPIRLVLGTTTCYRCGEPFEVAGLVGTVVEEGQQAVAQLIYMEELPQELLSLIQARVQGFERVYSAMAGQRYYANVCPHCHAFAGDHYLREPGEVFLPMDEQAEAALSSEILPIERPVEVRSSYGMSGWMDRL